MFSFVRSGTALPAGSRTDAPLTRLRYVITEVLGHTHFKGRPLVNVAHWLVMVGFLFGIIVWFEAYIQTFSPADGWPILNNLSAYHLIEEILAVGTVLGILFLIGVRLSLGHTDRASRFFNSQPASARIIEAIVFLEGLGMLLVKAAKIAAFGNDHPWASPISGLIAQALPASPTLVSAFALFKLLTGVIFLVLVAHNLSWGVAWHRFTAFFNIFFRRHDGGLGALNPCLLYTSDAADE